MRCNQWEFINSISKEFTLTSQTSQEPSPSSQGAPVQFLKIHLELEATIVNLTTRLYESEKRQRKDKKMRGEPHRLLAARSIPSRQNTEQKRKKRKSNSLGTSSSSNGQSRIEAQLNPRALEWKDGGELLFLPKRPLRPKSHPLLQEAQIPSCSPQLLQARSREGQKAREWASSSRIPSIPFLQ